MPSYVIITRSRQDSEELGRRLRAMGLVPLYCPSVAYTTTHTAAEVRSFFIKHAPYDWIVFTSRNGVRFLMEALEDQDASILALLRSARIATVGPKTAEVVADYGLSIAYIPTEYTAGHLAKGIPVLPGEHMLVPRSSIGDPTIMTQLSTRGARVVDLSAYQTTHPASDMSEIVAQAESNTIACLTFLSPSAVEGFWYTSQHTHVHNHLLSLPVISIGPLTTRAAIACGYTTVYTADTHTLDGILSKLQERIQH